MFSLIFADEEDIGFFGLATYPIRKDASIGAKGIKQGYTGEFEWLGYQDPSLNPHVINPKKGFIVTANNKVASENASFETYQPTTHRANMITRLLSEGIKKEGKLSPAQITNIQFETFDTLVAHKYSQMLSIFKTHQHEFGNLFDQHEFIQEFDSVSDVKTLFNFEVDSIASTFFSVWEYYWVDKILLEKFPEDSLRR